MKKILCMLMIAILIFSVCGCNDSSNEPDVFATDPPAMEGVSIEYVSADVEEVSTVVTLKWINNSDVNINFGRSSQLYQERDGKMEQIGSMVGDNGITILEPGQSLEVKYTPYQCTVAAGNKYRFDASFNYFKGEEPNTDKISVEFEVQ